MMNFQTIQHNLKAIPFLLLLTLVLLPSLVLGDIFDTLELEDSPKGEIIDPFDVTPTPSPEKVEIQTKHPIKNGYPVWVNNPSYNESIGAIGAADPNKNPGYSKQKKVAIALARTELGRQLGVHITGEVTIKKTLKVLKGEEDFTSKLQSLSKHHSQQLINNAIVEDEWRDPKTGELYIWLVINKKQLSSLGEPSGDFAEVTGIAEEIIAEGTYNMGDSETPLIAEKRALAAAKRIALEQAGTYVESYSEIKNFQLTKDEIQILAVGTMEVEILDKKREFVGNSIRFWVKIKAKVVTDNIKAMISRTRELKLADNYKSLQEDYETRQKEIEQLKKQMADVKEKNERKQLEIKIKDEERRFQAIQWNSMGNKYALNEEYDYAIEAYTSAIALIPNYARTYIARGFVYATKNLLDRAIKDLTKAIEIHPDIGGGYILRGTVYVQKNLLDRAIKDYTKAITIDPTSKYAYEKRAEAYERKEQYNKAIDDSTLAIALDPNLFEAYITRGTAYVFKKQHRQAIADYNKAIEINPDFWKAYMSRGFYYQLKKQYSRAIVDYSKAIEIKPGFYLSYVSRGKAYHAKEQYSQAIADYNKAIEINPDSADELNSYYISAYSHRGLIYYEEEQYHRAIADYSKAIEINPDIPLTYFLRGEVYRMEEQYSRAIADYSRAIEIKADLADAHFYRGVLYYKKNEKYKSKVDIERACDLGRADGCKLIPLFTSNR